jgi:molybdenum cofactor cytidylyltransferase
MNVAAIVLAAGRSTRMAPRNKLLEEIGSETMVRRVTRLALASSAKPVIVVTGFEAEAVGAALSGLDVRLVHNPSYAEGLSTSLRAGLAALPSSCDGALICLADMPWVEGSVLQTLITAFAANGPHSICVPTHHGRQGNPVLFGSAYFPEMKSLSGDMGAKPLMATHESQVVAVAVSTDSIFADADTTSDLLRSS